MKTIQTKKMNKSTKTNQPLVSVIMPVYNSEGFLVETLDSIFAQTYRHFELIAVDDASSDTSLSILKKYQKKYSSKMKIITMEKNLNKGGDTCANEALKIAKGTYIARMDADDVALPQRLEKQVAFLEKNKEVFLVGSNAHVIDRNGKIIGDKMEPETSEAIYKSYFTFHPLIHPTCMLRRFVDGKAFEYQIKYSANNDYYTFFGLLCQGNKFYNLQEKLLYYRIHGKNDTFVRMKEKFLNTLRIRMTMVFMRGYRPSLKGVIATFVQGATVLLLPEKFLTDLYLFSKGIKKLSLPAVPFLQPATK